MRLKTLFLVFLVLITTATCTAFVASTSQKPAENTNFSQCCPTVQNQTIEIEPLGDPIETPGMPG